MERGLVCSDLVKKKKKLGSGQDVKYTSVTNQACNSLGHCFQEVRQFPAKKEPLTGVIFTIILLDLLLSVVTSSADIAGEGAVPSRH